MKPTAAGTGGKTKRGAAPPGAKGNQPPAPDRPRPSRKLTVALCLALVVATLLVYARTRDYGFIELDDNCYVYENMTVKRGLTPPGAAWAFTTFHSANWHPLTWLSHMLDVRLFALNAGAHHLVNLAFHLANTLMLFLAFVTMTRQPWKSAIVAGIFALHPLHVESVAWIAERKDVLSTFFALLTLLFYIRYTRAPGVLRFLPVALVFALGLMAKPMLVTLPFVLLLVDVWPLRRMEWPPGWKALRKLVAEKAPFFAMVAASSVVTFLAQHRGGAVSSLGRLPFADRFATAAVAYVSYVAKAVWPTRLAVLYPYQGYSPERVFAALAILTVVTIAAFVWARKRPYVLVGWLWYLGMLVPVIGLVQVGAQSMADRYTYLPLVGLSFAVVWLTADALEGRRRLGIIAGAMGGVLVAALGAQAYRQVTRWQSSHALFEHALRVTDKNYIMHKSLAVVLDHEDRTDEAVAHYEKALAIKPDFDEAHNNLGMILDRRGRHEEAVAHYEKALASRGDYAEAHNNMGVILEREGKRAEAIARYEKAVALKGDFAEAYKNLASLLAREGRYDEAIVRYRRALAINPDYAEAHNNLGVILARGGKNDEAMSHYARALACSPDYAEAGANLGHQLLRTGKLDEAYAHLVKAVENNPTLFEAQADLGTLFAARGNFEQAKVHLEESLRLSPERPGVHNNLGFVLQRLGQIDESIVHCREALRLDSQSVDAHFNLAMAFAVKGMRTEAAAEFSTVLALKPGHAAARAALDQLRKGQ